MIGEVVMAIGDKLREALDQKELQQVDFAKKMNVSKSSINNYVTNRELPNILLVKDMAEELGISIDFLLDYQPNPDSVALSPAETELIKALRKLPKEKRVLGTSLIETLSQK